MNEGLKATIFNIEYIYLLFKKDLFIVRKHFIIFIMEESTTTTTATATNNNTYEVMSLNKAEMWDLYKLDRDARKSTGFGFFPQVYSDILERYFAVGDVDIAKANSALAELFRAKPDEIKI